MVDISSHTIKSTHQYSCGDILDMIKCNKKYYILCCEKWLLIIDNEFNKINEYFKENKITCVINTIEDKYIIFENKKLLLIMIKVDK